MEKSRFAELLNDPKVKESTPSDFNVEEESEFLSSLYGKSKEIQQYEFIDFISAGGAGMVFKVKQKNKDEFFKALKISRKNKYEQSTTSSFPPEELDALKELVHTNIVRLFEVINDENGNPIAICTSFIENPQGIDKYIREILDSPKSKGHYQISPERLDDACGKIIDWIYKISLAIRHMHRNGYCHLDIKPANILIQGHGDNVWPVITDMGSSRRVDIQLKKRVNFTWAYAHPELTDMALGVPGSIEGGGLRASAEVQDVKRLPVYDLYAFGKTIQEILAIIEFHFGEICFSNYYFRYMHIIAALLLDGKNRTELMKQIPNIDQRHGIRFISDFPMNYSQSVFEQKIIKSSEELTYRLKRYRKDYSIVELADEFSCRNENVINNTIGEMIPFSNRVSKIFNHVAVKRLYKETQLGLMTEIYPGASHNRWSHSLGVFSMVLKYYQSILSDPENPMVRIIIDKKDIDHALLAAILHDIGQTSLGHDFEDVNEFIFNHLKFIERLIYETCWNNSKSLLDTINEFWDDIEIERIIDILHIRSKYPIDYIASDSINSPIDADKLDYIVRDSYYCGVSYGDGIDSGRILNSLTISEYDRNIRLAYYAKGRTSISSMLLARYQMYGSLYWHHTYRCFRAMLYYAVQLAFGSDDKLEYNITTTTKYGIDEISEIFFYRVICRMPLKYCWAKLKLETSKVKKEIKSEELYGNDYALDFIYRFTNDVGKKLLSCIQQRETYVRIYTKNLKNIDISDLNRSCNNRYSVSISIQKKLLEAIIESRTKTNRGETNAEVHVSEEIISLRTIVEKDILVLIDYPQSIKMKSSYWPKEVGDSSRKFQNYGNDESLQETASLSNNLLLEIVSLRVYVEPNFYRLITRYLHPMTIESCIKNVISPLR